MMSRIDQRKADAIVEAVAAGRSDWDPAGIRAALSKAAPRCPGDYWRLLIVAAQAAMVPTNRTPAIVALDGDHWKLAGAEPQPPSSRPLRCATCHRIHDPGSPCGNPPSQVRRLEPGELRRRVTAARKEPA